MANKRPVLSVAPSAATPIHPSHRLALVGEALEQIVGIQHWLKGLGVDEETTLTNFARSSLLYDCPGPAFPVSVARPLAEPLCQQLAPRPLILLGQGVAAAFSFPPDQGNLSWVHYRLGSTWCCAAVIPAPGQLLYNSVVHRVRVADFLLSSIRDGVK